MVIQRRVKKQRSFWIILLDILIILCLLGFVAMLISVIVSALGL